MSRLWTFLFSLVALSGVLVSLFFAYGIFKALWFGDYYSLVPAFLKQDTTIQAVYPSSPSYMTKAQKKLLVSHLIEDYLVYRYTILPDDDLMAQRMGQWWSEHKSPIDAPYAIWVSPNENGSVWRGFIDPAGGFAPRVLQLVKEGKTRTVEILSSPYKEKDFWNVRLKLYTYAPDTDRVTISYLKIQMAVSLGDFMRSFSVAQLNPALLYTFKVDSFREVY
ncbi:MAG: hypothetical protein JW812_00560 [Alphaproteobacteria bacterium]|nr:hypothetical protein [Alphaproteobacteria bacterium]MBN2779708.1 hypothetical protein [Alphaproteobacteria bacterium]